MRSSSPRARIILVSADLSHITLGPNLDSCGPLLCSRTPNGLPVMSTSHADFLSTADLSLCARTVFITRGPLPVACGLFPSPFPSRGPLPPNAHAYTPHARTAVFSLSGRFLIRFAWRADSPQADLCASRADRFMLQTDLWPPPADLLRSGRRTLTNNTITTDLIHWDS